MKKENTQPEGQTFVTKDSLIKLLLFVLTLVIGTVSYLGKEYITVAKSDIVHEVENKILINEKERLEEAVNKTHKNWKEIKLEKEQLGKEVDVLIQQKELLTQKITNKEADLNALNGTLKKLEEDKEALQNAIKNSSTKFQHEREQLLSKIERSKQELFQLEGSRDQLQDRIYDLENSQEENVKKITSLENDLSQLNLEFIKKGQENARLVTMNKELKDELAILKYDMLALSRDNTALQADKESLSKEVAILKNKLINQSYAFATDLERTRARFHHNLKAKLRKKQYEKIAPEIDERFDKLLEKWDTRQIPKSELEKQFSDIRI